MTIGAFVGHSIWAIALTAGLAFFAGWFVTARPAAVFCAHRRLEELRRRLDGDGRRVAGGR